MPTYIIAFAATLLLLGAGCGNSMPETSADVSTVPGVKDAGPEHMLTEGELFETDEPSAFTDDTISLTATARVGQEVYFAWELPEGIEYDGFVIVRSEEPNPTHDQKNYWFRQHYTRRAVTWVDLPSGTWHFRVCGLTGIECSAYSNDVVVTVE